MTFLRKLQDLWITNTFQKKRPKRVERVKRVKDEFQRFRASATLVANATRTTLLKTLQSIREMMQPVAKFLATHDSRPLENMV